MTSRFLSLTIFLALIVICGCNKNSRPKTFMAVDEISFVKPDSLLSPQKIVVTNIDSCYRQYEAVADDPGEMIINKDETFILSFGGWIHQNMVGSWFVQNDTLNLFVTEDYCDDKYVANSNKNTNWKFVLVNNNFFLVNKKGRNKEPFLCIKAYDYLIYQTHI